MPATSDVFLMLFKGPTLSFSGRFEHAGEPSEAGFDVSVEAFAQKPTVYLVVGDGAAFLLGIDFTSGTLP